MYIKVIEFQCTYDLKYSWNWPGRRATGYKLGLEQCFGNLVVLFEGT